MFDIRPSPLPGAPPEAEAEAGQADAEAEQADAEAEQGGAEAEQPPPAPPPAEAGNLEEFDRKLEGWETTARRADTALGEGTASTPALEVLRERLAEDRAAAAEMAERARAAGEPLRAQLETLGPPPEEGEAAEVPQVADRRAGLQGRLDALDARLHEAELARTRADSLISEIDAQVRQRFAERLMSLGPSPLNPALWPKAAAELAGAWAGVASEAAEQMSDPVLQRDRQDRAPLVVVALAAGALLLLWGRRRLLEAIHARLESEVSRGERTGLAALAAGASLAAPAGAAALIAWAIDQSRILGPDGRVWAAHLFWGLLLFIAARGIAGAFYAPSAPALRLSWLGDAAATAAARRATALGLTLLLFLALVQAGERAELSAGTLATLNLPILVFGAAAMWGLARHVAPPPPLHVEPEEGEAHDQEAEEARSVEGLNRRIVSLAALAMRGAALLSVALAAAGYYAASQFAFYPLTMSLGVICTGMVIFELLRGWVEAHLDVRPAAAGGLRLLPVLAGFVIILLTLPALALIWGARLSDLAEAWRVIVEGAEIGGVRISPAAFLTFVIVFAIGYGLTRLVQTVLAGSVLPNMRMDAGGRSAITTGLGYAGFIIAGLLAISAAGLDLSNLAIVAGALSVGIGFGLQAIVNNFVSGIILLVERPIKVGDWILVGGDHGVVKRVSVRATQIETFDRSVLFLPNSDLISGKVV
ncbi:MAG: DUF3772 domain-containing protein, partial [Pseudomonadota bacterium]